MGNRLQTRRGDAEGRVVRRLTFSYAAVFLAVIVALSAVAYAMLARNLHDYMEPLLLTPEGAAVYGRTLRKALLALVAIDAALLVLVAGASYGLARAAVRPLQLAREREERFAADVAHELRTPLGVIASVAQAQSGLSEGPQREAFERIARQALEAGATVSDLLTLARGDGRDVLVTEPVDFGALAAEVARTTMLGGDNLQLQGEFASAIVDGDERRLAQLVRNLIANARRHARRAVWARVETSENEAILTVEDDGDGLAAEVAPRLFERFAKASDSPGSGLGLAIARWVARSHGGEVAFEGGSRFVARLPLGRFE